MGATPPSFRAAMATWRRTTGLGSRASSTILSRIDDPTWPMLPADQGPESVHPRRPLDLVVEDQGRQPAPDRRRGPLSQEPLRDVAVIDVRARQEFDQIVIARLRQVEAGPPRGLLVPDAIQPA